MPSGITMTDEHISEVVDKILQLMLCILSGLHSYNDMSTISGCSLQWATVFDLQKSRYWLQGFGLLELLFRFHFSGCFCLIFFNFFNEIIDVFVYSLLGFIQQLLQEDIFILNTFRVNILR